MTRTLTEAKLALACRSNIVKALDQARYGLSVRINFDAVLAAARADLEFYVLEAGRDIGGLDIDLHASLAAYDAVEEAMSEALREAEETGCGAFMSPVGGDDAAAPIPFQPQKDV
jgi:hypothetical protein